MTKGTEAETVVEDEEDSVAVTTGTIELVANRREDVTGFQVMRLVTGVDELVVRDLVVDGAISDTVTK